MLAISALAAVVVSVIAALAVDHQIDGTDTAAQANWWADYAEHVTGPVIAALLACTGRPGWRILAGLAAAAFIYLGAVATFVLTNDTGSWGTLGGAAAIAFGLVLAVTCLRGDATSSRAPRQ